MGRAWLLRFGMLCALAVGAFWFSARARDGDAAGPVDCLGVANVASAFAADYSCVSLGVVAGVPPLYGGLTFLPGDPNTLVLGGDANTAAGLLYEVAVSRDAQSHITGFSGTPSPYGGPSSTIGAYNDGGVVFGPGGVLFVARFPTNELEQSLPGGTAPAKVIDLNGLGGLVFPSISAVAFVPAGFPGAGEMKLLSFHSGDWYTANFVADGAGTYDIVSTSVGANVGVGAEGIAFVPPSSVGFPPDSVLIAEYGLGTVITAPLDVKGNPVMAQSQAFMSGLTGAEGAVIDPLTGDFLFSTFGGGDQIIRVTGFQIPPTATPTATVTSPAPPQATTTPTPTATATATPTATTTPTPTATATATPTATVTPSPVPPSTATPTATATPSPVPSSTATSTATVTPSPVPSSTATPIATATPSSVPSSTATSSSTSTAISVQQIPSTTATPTAAALATLPPTQTPLGATAAMKTATSIVRTSTAATRGTATAIAATSTASALRSGAVSPPTAAATPSDQSPVVVVAPPLTESTIGAPQDLPSSATQSPPQGVPSALSGQSAPSTAGPIQRPTIATKEPTPSSTPFSGVLGAQAGPPGGAASDAAVAPAISAHDEHRPDMIRAVPEPLDISLDPDVLVTNISFMGATLLLILLASQIFNSTISENKEELDRLMTAALSPLRPLWQAVQGNIGSASRESALLNAVGWPLVVLGLTVLIYGFVEPGFGLNGRSAVVAASILLCVGTTTYVTEGGEALFARRRYRQSTGVRPFPFAMIVAIVGVVLSRVVGFGPGVIYGFVGTTVYLRPSTLSREEAGKSVFVPLLALLAVCIAAWMLVIPLRSWSSDAHAEIPAFFEGAAVSIFVGGLQGLFFSMIPMSFMDGEKIWRWNKLVWLGLASISTFLFWHVLLNGNQSYFDALTSPVSRTAFGILTSSLLVSLAVWAIFRFRRGATYSTA